MNRVGSHPGQHAVASLYDVKHGLVVHQTCDDNIGGRGGFAGRRCGPGTQRYQRTRFRRRTIPDDQVMPRLQNALSNPGAHIS
jgi:hypothetical protein